MSSQNVVTRDFKILELHILPLSVGKNEHFPYHSCLVYTHNWLFTQNTILASYDVLRKHARYYCRPIMDLYKKILKYLKKKIGQ